MTKRWTLPVQYNKETDEYFIEFNEEMMEASGFRPGDTLNWEDNKDGSYTMTKKKEETQFVLVETISQFRQRYVVEVPTGIDQFGRPKEEWALDTVTCEEAKEFTQKHLGETIVSHRVVTEDEVMDIFRKDESYFQDWKKDQVFRTHVTSWKEQTDESISE